MKLPIDELLDDKITAEGLIESVLLERYARGTKRGKVITDPKTLLIALLAVGGSLFLWDRVEKFITNLFIQFTRDKDFKGNIDRMIYDTLLRIGQLVKPKLYPAISELQKEARSGAFQHMTGSELEHYIRDRVMSALEISAGEIDEELRKMAIFLRNIILSSVVDRLVVFLYQVGVRGE